MTVAFPAPYELDVDMSFEWVDGFEYPSAMKQELREKFPEWADLHKAVEMNDTVIPWNLLEAYQRRFAGISLDDIIKSAEDADLHKELVERAKQILSLSQFIGDIQQRYFPQGIQHEINKLMKLRRD